VFRWEVLEETAAAASFYVMVGGGPFLVLAMLFDHFAERL